MHNGVLLTVSAIVLFELWYGIAKSQRRQNNTNTIAALVSRQISAHA
jgi:predicted nucleic acid-binding protein